MTTEQTEADARNAMRKAGFEIVENRWIPKHVICAIDKKKFYLLNLNDNSLVTFDKVVGDDCWMVRDE